MGAGNVLERWTLVGLVMLGAWSLGAASPLTAQSDNGLLERAVSSRAKGADTAPVTVYEIADFQCPYCGQFAVEVGPRLDSAYVATGRVQWVFVNLPLHTHPLAWPAAEAAACAGALADAFWPMHDRLYHEQRSWTSASDPMAAFQAYAEELGVPGDAFRECTTRDLVAPLLLQDVTSVVGAQITGTPTFILMKGDSVVSRVVGVKSYAEWSGILDSLLAR